MTHIDINSLPDDPKKLKEAFHAFLDATNQRTQLLEHRLALLCRQKYGSTSEKLPTAQQTFDFAREDATEDLPEPQAERREEEREQKKTGKRRGRRPFPAHWPREDVLHELPERERLCVCCRQPMQKFGEEVSEELDYVPARCRVLRHIRPKYACQECHVGVKIAPPPAKVVEQGAATSGTVATVIVDKTDDHLPLYRQSERFARLGYEISRATLCSWVGQGAERLRPLWDYMRRDILQSKVIWTDDTPVKVQRPGTGKTQTARFWIYLGDEKYPYILFDYTPSRSRDGPQLFLKGFKGYLQADAYTGYDALYAGKLIIEVACWAHVRRKFFEAKENEPRALELLDLIAELYRVEDLARPWVEDARTRPPAEREAALASAYTLRQQLREAKAQPVLKRIEAWLEARVGDTLPKSPLGEAVKYARNQWWALTRYCEYGALEPDNNASERGVRCVAIGRKNWLFVGSDAGGERAAILYSIVATCKRHGVEPWRYLQDVLLRISTHPASRIEELLPQHWLRLFGSPETR